MDQPDTLGPRLELNSEHRPITSLPLSKAVVQIGRDPGVDIRFDDACISRHHARVEHHADGSYYLVDTSRHYTTFLNGRRLRESRPVRLGDGDRIQVGEHEIVFRGSSQVLVNDRDEGSSILETIGDLGTLDLAERSRSPAQTLRAVLNVNRSLGGGGELDEVLARALGSLMDLFPQAEFGVIVTVEPDGRLPVRAIRSHRSLPPKLTLSKTILSQVLRRGEAVLIRDVQTDARFKENDSIAVLFRTALCVPLPGYDGKPIGMVQLGAREKRGGRFSSEDLELLAALALPLAAAVDNHRLLRERAHWAAAREIQRALLPRERPDIPGYEFWECYRPALEVGGDFYDYIRADSDKPAADSAWFVGVGDVSGKGMPAALLSAAVCPEIRHAVRSGASAVEVLTKVNRHVCDGGFDCRFVTMILAELDPRNHRVTLAKAGHECPWIRRADGRVEQLELPGSGLPLGVLPTATYTPTSIDIRPGEVLVLQSDGLTDAQNPQMQRFGAERVERTLSKAKGGASVAGEALLEAVVHHAGRREPFDDLTIVCLSREEA